MGIWSTGAWSLNACFRAPRHSTGEHHGILHACLLSVPLYACTQAQQQLEVALSFSSSSADAGSIKTAIEKLTLNEEQEEDEL